MLGTVLKPVNNILGGIRLQTSVWGMPKPIVLGRARVSVNLLDYFDFVSENVSNRKKGASQSSSGKKGGGQYDYGAALMLGLCRGRGLVAAIGGIWQTQGQLAVNDTTETYTVPTGGGMYTATQVNTFIADLGVTRGDSFSETADDFGSPGPVTLTGVQQTPMIEVDGTPSVAGEYHEANGNYYFGAADAGKLMAVNYSYGPPLDDEGEDEDPITSVGFTLFTGESGQAAWDVLTSLNPSHAIGYSDLAYLASPRIDLGMGGVAPNYSVEVITNVAPGRGNGAGDWLPWDVFNFMFTDDLDGVGILSAELGDHTAFDNYCGANGLFVSATYQEQSTLSDLVQEILEGTNSELIEEDFLIKVVPRGDTTVIANGFTFTPNTAPVYDLTADDLIRSGDMPALKISIKDPEDQTNWINAQFQDRNNQYNNVPVSADDMNSVQQYGIRADSKDWTRIFKSSTPAIAAIQALLQRDVYITRDFKFTTTERYVLLSPMDVITLPEPKNGATVQTPVRITSVTEQENGTLDFEAEDFPWGCSGPTVYPKQAGASNGPNANAIPGPINTPIIFEALSRLNNQMGHALWFGVSGAQNWGGYRLYLSVDGGANYLPQAIGTWMAKSTMGVLTAPLADSADPDTTDTLAVDLTESNGALSSYSAADTNAFVPLYYVDDGGAAPFELVAGQTATLTAANKYSIGTLLRRGVFNSPIGLHPEGSNFLSVDGNVFGWLYDPTLIGVELFFKFASLNQVGLEEQDISTVTAYSFTPTGASLGLLMPAHATYAPTSNPLTAFDAGTSATIDIAAFQMAVPGVANINEDSGDIAGLAYNTLYYIYFDDPGFAGGAVTYEATTDKIIALGAAGRFFVGSILTPASGFLGTTIGNDDGGAGAQTGVNSIIGFATSAPTFSGTGSVANAGNLIDGNANDVTSLSVAASGAGTAQVLLAAPASVLQRASSVGLRFTWGGTFAARASGFGAAFSMTVTSPLGTTVIPISGSAIIMTSHPDGTVFVDLTAALGSLTNLSGVTLAFTVESTGTLIGSSGVGISSVFLELKQ